MKLRSNWKSVKTQTVPSAPVLLYQLLPHSFHVFMVITLPFPLLVHYLWGLFQKW